MTIHSAPVTHPLKPLSGEELGALVQAVKSHIKQQYGSNVTAHFKAAFLVEPPKAQLAPYLDELAAGGSPSPLPRCGEALLDIRGRDKAIFAEYYVSLSASAAAVDKVVILDEHSKVGLDAVEMIKAEEMLNASSEYQEVVKKLRLPEKAKVIAVSER
jgi:primary-amine oxidase